MSDYRKTTKRATAEIVADCFADPRLFVGWDKMTDAERNEFTVNGPIPCEGGGIPGTWCDGCRFGEVVNVDVEILKRAKVSE